MRTVRQLDKAGCGIACVAMFAGVSYTAAKKIVTKYCPRAPEIGTPTKGVSWALKQYKIKSKGRLTPLRGRLPRTLKQNALLKVNTFNKGRDWHWVVWDAKRKKILDPAEGERNYIFWSYMIVEN